MRTTEYTAAFKRDYKRVKKTPIHATDVDALLVDVVDLLAVDLPLPAANVDHPLGGQWIGHRDCHLKSDLILIYRKADFVDAKTRKVTKVLQLFRLGSHSEIF